MYRSVRTVHAYCALLLLLFIAMYAVTGFVLVHANQFDFMRPVDAVNSRVELDFAGDPDDVGALYDYLAEELDLGGRRQPVQVDASGTRVLAFARRGGRVTVRIAPDLTSADMWVQESTFAQRTVWLHRLVANAGPNRNVFWGVVVDLVSLAMIVFAGTGIYMWHTRTKDRRLGWILLSASWGLTFGVSAYFYFAP